MAKKIFRIISWSLLALTLLSILLIFRKPSIPPVEISAEAAKSFDQKLVQLNQAHEQRRPAEVHITEAELNSKLQERLKQNHAAGGSTSLKEAVVNLEGNRLRATFTVNVKGRDFDLTLGGNLGVDNGALEFKPADARLGSLPVPLALIGPAIRERLNSPEMRERMKLPDFIKDVRLENGELVLQSQ